MTHAAPEYTLVFDGHCRMCNRFAASLRRWDRAGAIELIPSQDPTVAKRFPWIPSSAYAQAMQLIRSDGRTWQGAAALETIVTMLPRGRWVSWLFRLPFARPLADRIYRWVARNRYRLGCSEHCDARQRADATEPASRS